jgi:hypothetical protein
MIDRSGSKGEGMDLPCPNCGKTIRTLSANLQVTCPNCKEELEWSADGTRLLLSKPLPTYLDPGDEAAEIAAIWDRADQVEGMIDLRRRQATVELAAKWIGDRIALGNRNLKLGGGLVILCVVLMTFAIIKISTMDTSIPMDAFLLFIVAALIIPFGFFFFVWSMVDKFTIANYIKKIQEERRILQEEEQAIRN